MSQLRGTYIILRDTLQGINVRRDRGVERQSFEKSGLNRPRGRAIVEFRRQQGWMPPHVDRARARLPRSFTWQEFFVFASRSLEPPMLPGPVFFHELRTVARRRRSYALRTALGLFLLYLMIQSTNRWDPYASQSETNREYSPGELALIGMNLFGTVIWLQGIVILLLTPAFVAGTIAEDRQRKVLSYLLASPLSGAEIVLGKLAARLLNLVVLVAVGLPVVSIALFLGGVDPVAVWLCYGTSFSTLYLLAAIVDFCLDVLRRGRGMRSCGPI